MRRVLVWLHRWVALLLGAWFALLGLTGAAMVWHDELDAWLNPEWFAARPACSDVTRPVARTIEVFAGAAGGVRPAMISAPRNGGAVYVVSERAVADGTRRQHFIDASCGRYLGMRDWGAARLDRAHVVPAIYELHRSLLGGETGHTLVGIGGLVLLGITLSGLALAWPRGAQRVGWRRALTIKRTAAAPRIVYDVHRAVGLWVLPFLLLMCITGAYLSFPKQGRALVGALMPTLDG
ncbi:MAG TPA: PepSY-associated TM helix domain-containing protein, partial [Burkholderiaceae bacterium]|nr:PepSY-associated TM helix domain-containing protein [Burkholderiaceae bacterium]